MELFKYGQNKNPKRKRWKSQKGNRIRTEKKRRRRIELFKKEKKIEKN